VLGTAAGESLIVPDAASVGAVVGKALDLTVRPEKIAITVDAPPTGGCVLRGRVSEVVYLGTSTQYAITTNSGTELTVFTQNSSDALDIAERGDSVWLSWRPEHSLALADTLASAPDPVLVA
jgi:spermidine/putrescine transport system ATP-binding protein